MRFKIQQPSSKEEFKHYYHLRWKILRAPWSQPEGSEVDDIEDQCFHVMAVSSDNKVVGVARLQFNSKIESQIRYMAVAKDSERQGIGQALVNAIEQHAKSQSCRTIMLDAREPAVDFYKKLGYKVIKKTYLLFDLIQHFQMVKEIH